MKFHEEDDLGYYFSLEFWIVVFSLVVLTSVFFFLIIVSKNASEWQKFKAIHNCKVFAERTAQSFDSGARGYRCDNGMEYWR